MEQRHQTERQQERTAKPTGKAGPRPWEIEQYIYQEEPREEKRSSHCDPRLELALQSHSQHQDSDIIPPDDDYGYSHPAFGSCFTYQLDASTSTTSDFGALAGSGIGQGSAYTWLNDKQKKLGKILSNSNPNKENKSKKYNDQRERAKKLYGAFEKAKQQERYKAHYSDDPKSGKPPKHYR
jgi:hypothetical protein